MIKSNIKDDVRVAGLTLAESVALDSDGVIAQDGIALPAAQQATGWVLSTSGLTGTLTMGTGHTLTTAGVVDLYWTETVNGKAVQKGRRGVVLGTVAGDQVPVTDSGAGDALPAESTSLVITVGERVTIDATFDGDLAVLAAFATVKAGAFSFTGVDLVEDFGRTLPAGTIWKWYLGNGEGNPFAGDDITNVIVSQGSTADSTGQVAVQYNNA